MLLEDGEEIEVTDTREERHASRKSGGGEDGDSGNAVASGDGKGSSTNTGSVEVCTSFDAMDLKPLLLKGIYSYGFEKPSAIQQRAIKPISSGRDVIAQSQSGTGKTAVFSIGCLQVIDNKANDVQALALSPTRELAEQSERVMASLGDFMNVKCYSCIGGRSIGEDIKALEAGVHCVSGTPGRVYDMISIYLIN